MRNEFQGACRCGLKCEVASEAHLSPFGRIGEGQNLPERNTALLGIILRIQAHKKKKRKLRGG